MKVYIECLRSYNQGKSRGKWIELPMNKDDLREEVKSVLVGEELLIADVSSEYGLSVDEHACIYDLNIYIEDLYDLIGSDCYNVNQIKVVMDHYEVDTVKELFDVLEQYEFRFWYYDNYEDIGYEMLEQGYLGVCLKCKGRIKDWIDYDELGRSSQAKLYPEYGLALEEIH